MPTHVQAEDKVLLWFTFPQIVAMTAVGALAYGAYRYAPIGPSEARMALAAVVGLVGLAMTVGKVGGRRLPLAAADLLRFGLGPRRYAGPPAELARSEPPAPVVREPGPLSLLARRVRRGLRGLRKKKRSSRERRNGGCPSAPATGSASADSTETSGTATATAIRPPCGSPNGRGVGGRSWPLPP